MTRAAGSGTNHRVLTVLARGDKFEPGSPDARPAYFLGLLGADPQALLYVLESLVATSTEALRSIETPALVAVGDEDQGHATGEALAAALPNVSFAAVSGDHWTTLTGQTFADVIVAFLADQVA